MDDLLPVKKLTNQSTFTQNQSNQTIYKRPFSSLFEMTNFWLEEQKTSFVDLACKEIPRTHKLQITSNRSSNVYVCSSGIQSNSNSARTVSRIDQFHSCVSFHFDMNIHRVHVIMTQVISILRQYHWMRWLFSLRNLIKFIVFPFHPIIICIPTIRRNTLILCIRLGKRTRFFIQFYLWPKRIIVRK